MELKKHYNFQIPKFIQFYELQIPNNIIDNNYFIEMIDKGCNSETNLNNKTNVKGQMTSWNYFVNDEKFTSLLKQIFKSLQNIKPCTLFEAWGIKMTSGNFSKPHDHTPCDYSGILYLNDADNMLCFPEINVNLIPKKNSLFFFSSLLEHSTSPVENKIKYAIPFNMNIKKDF